MGRPFHAYRFSRFPPELWGDSMFEDVYDRLYAHFGPSSWWPAVVPGSPGNARPPKAPPFEVIVGAILVQNIAWRNVESALLALYQKGWLEPQAMHQAPLDQLESLIRPTGYFRQKALKLKGFLAYLYERHGGSLEAMLAMPLQELKADLMSVRGIGPETCDCILCYAAGHPVMTMDTYTRRIFSRVGLVSPDASYQQMQQIFHDTLDWDTVRFGEYHALIDTLGHNTCLKRRPRCSGCPLASICRRLGVEEHG